jgi:peptidoglycan/LPS O-acetylase OafA/YrhL
MVVSSKNTIADQLPGLSPRRLTIQSSFDPKHNSLNFLRLLLAATVLFSHAILLGGYADERLLNTNLSTIALYGFFGLSGFLITGSAGRNGTGRYLWQRFLRVFPGFWVCLVLTAFLFAGVAWVYGGQGTPHCGYGCFVRQPAGPFKYVYENALLRINQPMISQTPRNIPFAHDWNGALWSLTYEFLCYLLLALIAFLGLLKRRRIVLAITVLLVGLEFAVSTGFNSQLHTLNSSIFFLGHIAVFVPLFLAGGVLYLYQEKLPDSGKLALVSSLIFVASLWWPLDLPTNRFTGQIGGAALFAPAIIYPLLWLSIHLPFQKIGAKNDYSYGLYIYGWPVQELMVAWGVQRWGYPAYAITCLVVTIPFAVASWWLIERHALALKAFNPLTTYRQTRQSERGEIISGDTGADPPQRAGGR